MPSREDLALNSVCIWSDNPRHGLNVNEEELTEEEVINILIEVVGTDKMYNLIEDIVATKGLLGNVNPVVVKDDQTNRYLVYDGNRRISSLKIINDPNIVEDESLRKSVEKLIEGIDISFTNEVFVYITNQEEALSIMDKTHSGEQGGVGMISWEPYQRDISLYRRNKTLLYPHAFSVANTLKYKPKDFSKIPYTDLNRLFGAKTLKDAFEVDESKDDYKDKVELVISLLLGYKKEIKFKSFSRQFNKTRDGEVDSSVGAFVEWAKEKEAQRKHFYFESQVVEIFEDEVYDFKDLKYSIKSADNNEGISFNSEELSIVYTTPNGEIKDTVDTSIFGQWAIEITYKGEIHNETIIIQSLLEPKIEFRNINEFPLGETIKLDDLVIRAIDSHGENVKSNLTIEPVGENIAKIMGNTFTADNIVNDYTIKYSFLDQTGEPVSRTKIITIIDQAGNVNAKSLNVSLISFDGGEVTISISAIVNALIEELNKIDLNEYKSVVVTSLRSVMELTLDELKRKKIYTLSDKDDKDFGKRLEEFKSTILRELSNLCVNNREVLVSYMQEQNRLRQLDMQYLTSYLHLATHKSVSAIDVSQLSEIGKKYIGPLLVYADLLLKEHS